MNAAYAILPAAGRSRRMGEPKLLLPWKGKTIMQAVLERWAASRIDQIVVVTHPEDSDLHRICRLPESRKTSLLIAADPPADMKASVQLALNWLAEHHQPSPGAAWLVAPADIPQLSPAVIDQLLRAHEATGDRILAPACGQERGHPVLFPWAMAAEVGRVPADRGIDYLLDWHGYQSIECGPDALARDIDTPEQYEAVRDEAQSSGDEPA